MLIYVIAYFVIGFLLSLILAVFMNGYPHKTTITCVKTTFILWPICLLYTIISLILNIFDSIAKIIVVCFARKR